MQSKILALDAFYNDANAHVIGVVFSDFGLNEIKWYNQDTVIAEEYIPGQFYKRELPCLLNILNEVDLSEIDLIIIDGYVFLDDLGKKGLGAHLFDSIKQKVPIMGVAKSKFYNNTKTTLEVFRGKSKRPLYVSSIGIEIERAADLLMNLVGNYRMPDILKKLDQITKGTTSL